MHKKGIISIDILFILLLFINVALGYFLIFHIPFSFPFGGPDELMHSSMANYIAKHLEWPNWDSREVIRNAYGVSYSSGGSIVYWLHGLAYKIFGVHRIGAFILLLVYLLIASLLYRKNRIAGFLLLAALFPQTLFIFSYENSDTGTIISAILLGLSAGLFFVGENKIKYFFLFFFFAGFAVTARQHLWAIAFVTFIWGIIYKRRVLLSYDKKIWIYALIIALIPASWWFITSYLANDGDILGVFVNAKSIAKFAQEGLPPLARNWEDISIINFLTSTLISLYANWGWMTLPLDGFDYILVGVFFVISTVVLFKYIDKKIFLFILFLIVLNFGFMLLYATFYDYQAQGRYLFPSIYISVGVIASVLLIKNIHSKNLLTLLILLSLLNSYFAIKLTLTSYNDDFIKKPLLWENPSINFDKDAAIHIDQTNIIDRKLYIKGWAFDKKTNSVFNNIYLILKNRDKYYRVPIEQEDRPDVAKAFNNKKIEHSGFYERMILIKSLPKGKYSLYIGGELNGKFYLIDPDINFKK